MEALSFIQMNTKIDPSQRFSPNSQAVQHLPPIQKLAFADRGVRRAGLQAGNRFPETASSGGGKQHDGFAGEVIGFKECVDDGRRDVPPDREAQQDRIVGRYVQIAGHDIQEITLYAFINLNKLLYNYAKRRLLIQRPR